MKYKAILFLFMGIMLVGSLTVAYEIYTDVENSFIETELNLSELELESRILNSFPYLTNITYEEGKTRLYYPQGFFNNIFIDTSELERLIYRLELDSDLTKSREQNDLPLCIKADDGILVGCSPIYDGRNYNMVCRPTSICEGLGR